MRALMQHKRGEGVCVRVRVEVRWGELGDGGDVTGGKEVGE